MQKKKKPSQKKLDNWVEFQARTIERLERSPRRSSLLIDPDFDKMFEEYPDIRRPADDDE